MFCGGGGGGDTDKIDQLSFKTGIIKSRQADKKRFRRYYFKIN